jgi:hypothetical protein
MCIENSGNFYTIIGDFKMNKNINLLRIAFCIITTFVISSLSFAGTYSGGAGTAGDPYLISSVDDFMELRNTSGDYNKYFHQTSDLDLSSLSFYGAAIAQDTDQSSSGFQGTSFTGTYDGMDNSISNFTIYTVYGNTTYVGLFGYNQGTVTNLSVSGDIDLYQGTYVGILCGYNSGNITDCHSFGTILCGDSSENIGGFVGRNYNGSISHSLSSVTVTCVGSGNYIGGFVGQHDMYRQNRTVKYCCSLGNVSVGDNSIYVGGFCGYMKARISVYYDNHTLYTRNCYANNDVSCGNNSEKIGGFCGELYSDASIYNGFSEARIDRCYSVGDVITGSSCTDIGAFNGNQYGYNGGTVSVINSFWNTDLCSQASSDGGIDLTDAQMKDISVYLQFGWDFVGESVNGTEDIWMMPTNNYPQFVWQETLSELVAIDISGPDSVYEYNTGSYTCIATYSDSSTSNVTSQTSWSLSDTTFASIDPNGRLNCLETVDDEIVTVVAQYQGLEANKQVTIETVIPDIIGLSMQQADLVLLQNALDIGEVTFTYTDEIDKSFIISQDPLAGTPALGVAVVNIEISLGSECLEYFRGDINGDCMVDMYDFMILSQDWLSGVPVEETVP